MQRIKQMSSDEEDDIWDYRSQTQRAPKKENADESCSRGKKKAQPAIKSRGKTRSSFSQVRVKTEDVDLDTGGRSQKQKKPVRKRTKVKLEVKTESTPNAKKAVDRSGRCPVCQMPFALLSMIETPSWHVDQCLDVPYSSKNECQGGLECNSEIASHYKKFRHTQLARSRRKNETNEQRDKGDVDSAKTKLRFDVNGSNTELVVPGSSAECVIVLDSSQDSNFSQQQYDSVLDDRPLSKKDETDGGDNSKSRLNEKFEKVSTIYDKTIKEKSKLNCTVEKQSPKIYSDKVKIVDKFKNHLIRNKGKTVNQLDKQVRKNNSDVDEMFLTQVEDNGLPEIKSRRESLESSAGISRVEIIDISENSYGSVQDINDLVDDTRSLSDMINDALNPDDVGATEDNGNDSYEVENEDNDNDSNEVVNENYIKRRSKSGLTEGYESEVENENVEDSDSIIDLFTTKSDKPSALSCLRETPAKSPDSDSSTDWEILRTTMTWPSFGDKLMKKELDEKKVLSENSSNLYKEGMKTPYKNSQKIGLREKRAKDVNSYNKKESEKKQKETKRGFFATKKLQNALRFKMTLPGQANSPCLDKDTRQFLEDEGNTDESRQDTGHKKADEKSLDKTDEEVINKASSASEKKKKSRAQAVSGFSAIAHSYIKPEIVSGKDRDALSGKNGKSCRLGSAKLETSVPSEEKSEGNDIVEKKRKIEVKPRTPAKRRLGKNVSKKQKVKRENDIKEGQTSVASFFNPKGKKLKQISIQTDSESSGDCDRFNRIGKFVKCCAKCSEEQCGRSNYIETLTCLNGVSSTNGSPCMSSQTNLASGRRNDCTPNTLMPCVKLSNSDKCSACSCSMSSSQATSCRGCGCSHNYLCSSFSRKYPCFGLPSHTSNSASSCGPSPSQEFVHHHKCAHRSESHCSSQQLPEIGSQQNHIQNCLHSSPKKIGSQSSQGSGTQRTNNSLKNNSSCSLHFNIENVCTVSQNTYSNMAGGFIPENGDASQTLNSQHCASLGKGDSSCTSCPCRQSSESSGSLLDTEVETVVQIRKSATDILMASSRLLYSKSIKNNPSSNGKQKQGNGSQKLTVNEALKGKSVEKNIPTTLKETEKFSNGGQNWNGERATTSTETSENTTETKRKCPFYKKIPDTCMTVDAFRYGNVADCRVYILSHFHYDHYMGLNKHFKNPIYCSKITGNLVKKKIGVDAQYIHTLPLYTPTVVENVELTFLEANHCPGAVLILFKLKSGKVFLHTGDFRACQAMELYPQLQNLRIHSLYLDTTYCDPQYDFPPQEEVVQFTVKLALDALTSNPKTLIVCGSYSIGKERIFTAIAEELGCKICVTRDKKTILDCMEDSKLKQCVSLRWEESCLHVLPMNKINYQGLQEHLLVNGKSYNSVLGIEPTGWTHSKKNLSLYHIKPKVNKDNIKVYGIPYSEHSSFLELKRFVQFTKPAKILPTVNNGNVHSRRKMEVIFEAWMEELQAPRIPTNRQSSITGWTK